MINSAKKSNDDVYSRVDTQGMILIETLSLFQENPQNNDQILTFQTKKQTQKLSCSSHLKQRDTGHESTNDKSTNEVKKQQTTR